MNDTTPRYMPGHYDGDGCKFPDAGHFANQPRRAFRYDQCDDTCTVDCGHCKGRGRPAEQPQRAERLISEIREGAFAQGTANLIAYAGLHFKVLGFVEPDLMTTIRDHVGLPPKEAV